MTDTIVHKFPLYDSLLEKVKSGQCPTLDLGNITGRIRTLGEMEKDKILPYFRIISFLIFHHSLLKGIKPNRNVVPLGGSGFKGGKGAMYKLEQDFNQQFDEQLQAIVSLYVLSITVAE